MTNDPSSGQTGGQPPEERPEQAGPPPSSMGGMGGGSMPESSGEPTRDFSAGAPPPSGGYTPPPSGGYMPPPPSGGYTPPPPSGGYTPPPPPPGGGLAPPSRPEGGGQLDFQALIQSYINAVTKPNAATYEAEIPNASWMKIAVGVIAVAVVSALIALIGVGAGMASLGQFQDQLGDQELPFDPTMFAGQVGVAGAISSLFFTPIFFLLGSGLLWLMAKMFGGQNSDFMTHSYLLSLSYTPLRIASTIIGIIPIIGGLIALVLSLYQLYSAGLAMQASQRMAPGRAQLAAFLPTIVGIVLLCLCFIIIFAGLAAALSGAGSNP